MITRRDFDSFEAFEESGTAGNYEELTFITEKGWKKVDLLTECKSWKTAVKRFFKAIGNDPDFEGWEECIRESAEAGSFRQNDSMMADGTRNEFPGWAYEIEEVNEGTWYIFLNIRYLPY